MQPADGGASLRMRADQFITALSAVVVLAFTVMMALVLLQVIDRFMPGPSFFWTEELVRMLLVWSVMLGLPVVLYQRQEIVVDVIMLSGGAEQARQRLATALGIAFLAVLAWQGVLFTLKSAGFTSPTLGLSRAWIYAPIPVGAVLGIVALLIRPEPDRSENVGELL